jgi:hypothetical protein
MTNGQRMCHLPSKGSFYYAFSLAFYEDNTCCLSFTFFDHGVCIGRRLRVGVRGGVHY